MLMRKSNMITYLQLIFTSDFLGEVSIFMPRIRFKDTEIDDLSTDDFQMDKMNEYCRRLQILNRDILELTKRVRLMVSRAQILSKKRNDSIDLLAC